MASLTVWLRRSLAVASAAGVLVVGSAATPAMAHTLGPGVAAMDYRTTLTNVFPQPAGLSLRVVDDGLHVIATNSSSLPLVIFGYAGEPYLRVDRWGAWENLRSPATYLNRSFIPGAVPSEADTHAAPLWHRVSDSDHVMWHDHRLHWMGTAPPLQVQANPNRYNLISIWEITGRYGDEPFRATGSLAWVPRSSPTKWLLLLGVSALGAVALSAWRPRRWGILVSLVTLVGLDAARSLGLVAGRAGPLATRLQALPWRGVPELAFCVVVLAVAVVGRRRAVLSRYVAVLVAAGVLLLDGAVGLPALWRSQVLAWHPWWVERGLIATTIGVAIGTLIGGLLQLQRMSSSAARRAAIGAAGATLLLSGCGGASATASKPVTISTTTLPSLGKVLATADGHVLYMFAPDRRRKVACSTLCQGTWPPVTIAADQKLIAGPGLRASLLGRDPNPQGGPAVATYNGWPLYTYVADVDAGLAVGQALNLDGGLWYVLSPSGQVIKRPVR